MFKFILGPLTGYALGVSMWETALLTVIGMMLTTLLLTLGRQFVFTYFIKKKKRIHISSKKRKIIKFWQRYGAVGVFFLTPLIFSPPLGTLIVLSFREKAKNILLGMTLSAVLWGTILTLLVYEFNSWILSWIP